MKRHQQRTFRLLAAVLSVLLLCGTAAGIRAASVTSQALSFPRFADDPDGTWGTRYLRFLNGWDSMIGVGTTVHTTILDGQPQNFAYCISVGTARPGGSALNAYDQDFFDLFDPAWNDLLDRSQIKTLLSHVLYYGQKGPLPSANFHDWEAYSMSLAQNQEWLARYMATQTLVWETVCGERKADFTRRDSMDGMAAVRDLISPEHPLYGKYGAAYDEIVSSVRNALSLPSFLRDTEGSALRIELEKGADGWTAVLADTGRSLAGWQFSAGSGIVCTVSGNELILRAQNPPLTDVTVTAVKTVPYSSLLIWSPDNSHFDRDSSEQPVVQEGQALSTVRTAYVKAYADVPLSDPVGLILRKTDAEAKDEVRPVVCRKS